MFIRSYKYYLSQLQKSSKTSPVTKLIILISAAVFIVIGIASSTLYYFYQKEAPVRAQQRYLQTASGGFNSIETSLNEILSSLKVAGSKAQIIDITKESSPSASGYFVSLDDVQKMLSNLERVQSELNYQRDVLDEQNTPQKYANLNTDLLNFYDQIAALLNNLAGDQRFLKDILLSVGPDFYLPVLTDQNLWNKADKLEIISYYEKNKILTNSSLASLAEISPPAKFKSFYDAQIDYFELVVKVSDNIIATLKQSDTQDKEAATQIEAAYQMLIGAQRENQKLLDSLTSEKLKVFDTKRNLAEFSAVSLNQNSIKGTLSDYLTNQPRPKFDTFPQFLQKTP